MKTHFIKKLEVAKNIYTFWFEPEKPVDFTAGQFTEMKLNLNNPDDRGDKRWFTISSSPSEKMLAITTHIDTERPSAFKQRLFDLPQGETVNLATPMGDFVLPQKKDIPIVFVAGGIGITPMHSMIKYLADTNEKRQINLYYAAKTLDDVAFRDLFEAADINFEIILSRPNGNWKGKKGRLDVETIMKLPGVKERALVYISGPEPMVEAFYKGLKNNGIPEHRLIMDYFPGYSDY